MKKKYGKPRKTQIIYADDIPDVPEEEPTESYAVYVVLTKEGYFKKITRQSLRVADEQKLKDGDEIANAEETDNTAELLFFTDKAQVYKAKVDDFDTTKASALGDYIPAKLGMEEDEHPVMMKALKEYSEDHHMIFLFANGKGVRVPVTAYETKNNRKKLTGAFSDASPIVAAIYEGGEPMDLLLENSADKGILISSDLISVKTTRSSQGITLFNMKENFQITDVRYGNSLTGMENVQKLRKNKVPATGIALSVLGEQMKLE